MSGPREIHFAAVYDISEDRERDKIDRLLPGFGRRVQKSVFECRLTRAGAGELQRRLEALKLQSGFLILYRLQTGHPHARLGNAPPAFDQDAAEVV
jgi:CRISPR-associated protein Cas2